MDRWREAVAAQRAVYSVGDRLRAAMFPVLLASKLAKRVSEIMLLAGKTIRSRMVQKMKKMSACRATGADVAGYNRRYSKFASNTGSVDVISVGPHVR